MSDEEKGQVIPFPITLTNSNVLHLRSSLGKVERLVIMPGGNELWDDIMILYDAEGKETMRLPFPAYNQNNRPS